MLVGVDLGLVQEYLGPVRMRRRHPGPIQVLLGLPAQGFRVLVLPLLYVELDGVEQFNKRRRLCALPHPPDGARLLVQLSRGLMLALLQVETGKVVQERRAQGAFGPVGLVMQGGCALEALLRSRVVPHLEQELPEIIEAANGRVGIVRQAIIYLQRLLVERSSLLILPYPLIEERQHTQALGCEGVLAALYPFAQGNGLPQQRFRQAVEGPHAQRVPAREQQ